MDLSQMKWVDKRSMMLIYGYFQRTKEELFPNQSLPDLVKRLVAIFYFSEWLPPPPPPMAQQTSLRWTCPMCSFQNHSTTPVCSMCQQGPPPPPPLQHPQQHPRQYRQQTYAPPPMYPNIRDNNYQQQQPTGNYPHWSGWTCPTCTFPNQPATTVCKICGTTVRPLIEFMDLTKAEMEQSVKYLRATGTMAGDVQKAVELYRKDFPIRSNQVVVSSLSL